MTNSKNKSQDKLYKEWAKTSEADELRNFEESLGLRLDGIAYFLSNNPPLQKNDKT